MLPGDICLLIATCLEDPDTEYIGPESFDHAAPHQHFKHVFGRFLFPFPSIRHHTVRSVP